MRYYKRSSPSVLQKNHLNDAIAEAGRCVAMLLAIILQCDQ